MDYIKKEVKEMADNQIAELQKNVSVILAENTNDCFKSLSVNGKGEHIVSKGLQPVLTTYEFNLAYNFYIEL